MPPELKNRPDLTLGKDRGRLWRIVPEKHMEQALRPNLGKVKSEDLVEQYFGKGNHPWQQQAAYRLVLERKYRPDPSSFARYSRRHDDAQWLLRVISLLGVLNTDEKSFRPILKEIYEGDGSPWNVKQAVRLAEPWIDQSEWIREELSNAAHITDDRVRFQVALSLGEWDNDRILSPLTNIALLDADDKWTRLAIASSVPKRAGALIVSLLSREQGLTKRMTAGRLSLLRELATLVGGRRDPAEVAKVLLVLRALPEKEGERWQMAALEGMAEGMGRRGGHLGSFLKSLPETYRPEVEGATRLLAHSAALAADAKRETPERLPAVRLLAHASWEQAGSVLTRLMESDPAPEVRMAAVRALAAHSRSDVPRLLLEGWRAFTPALRREVTEALMRQPDWIMALLKEVEAGRVKPGDLDVLRARQLVAYPRPEIREKARKLLQASLPADRREVLARYQESVKRKGDVRRGKEIFKKQCATCHHVDDVGVNVGPDISDARTKTAEMLLTDILNPNAAVDGNYVNYMVTLKSGRQLTGIIAAETASSLTLRRAENQSDVVLRQDVEEITSTGVSLMPEGMEKNVGVDEMADLLSFLKNWRYLEERK